LVVVLFAFKSVVELEVVVVVKVVPFTEGHWTSDLMVEVGVDVAVEGEVGEPRVVVM
jgi:hypothetical protein